MVFPIVPVVGGILAALGLSGLYWYYQLSKEEREEADRIAIDYAESLYDKGLSELTSRQLDHVHQLTKKHFA